MPPNWEDLNYNFVPAKGTTLTSAQADKLFEDDSFTKSFISNFNADLQFGNVTIPSTISTDSTTITDVAGSDLNFTLANQSNVQFLWAGEPTTYVSVGQTLLSPALRLYLNLDGTNEVIYNDGFGGMLIKAMGAGDHTLKLQCRTSVAIGGGQAAQAVNISLAYVVLGNQQ